MLGKNRHLEEQYHHPKHVVNRLITEILHGKIIVILSVAVVIITQHSYHTTLEGGDCSTKRKVGGE